MKKLADYTKVEAGQMINLIPAIKIASLKLLAIFIVLFLSSKLHSQNQPVYNECRAQNVAKEDLIRIHHYRVQKYGFTKADKYFEPFFDYFEIIAQRPFSFESVDYIKIGYRCLVCGADSIYFKVNNDIVEIMAIVGRQDLNNILID